MAMLYLASNSPRRKELLSWLEIPFEIIGHNFDEDRFKANFASQFDPEELSANLAYEKAKSAANHLKEGLILVADTEVYLDNRSLGKPKDIDQARQMLLSLSGRQHTVITAVCLIRAETLEHGIEIETSRVEFFNLKPQLIDVYLKRRAKNILDKAGAYAIQDKEGQKLVADFQGSLSNIIGLPLAKTASLLEEFGLVIDKDIKQLALAKFGRPD